MRHANIGPIGSGSLLLRVLQVTAACALHEKGAVFSAMDDHRSFQTMVLTNFIGPATPDNLDHDEPGTTDKRQHGVA